MRECHGACPRLLTSPWRCAAQIPEILPEEVLTKMHAAPKADVPLADVHDITQYDGFIFGFPTRCALLCTRLRRMTLHLPLPAALETGGGGEAGQSVIVGRGRDHTPT